MRVTIVRRLTDMTKELDLAVHTLSTYPEMNNPIKMEVGIEECLHIGGSHRTANTEYFARSA